ncbi:MAG: hypothetical protein V7645_2541, partial [Actinomycetota bacterium]
VNWYVEFDEPKKDADGHYWIARDAKLTKVRGGHCVCLKPKGHSDPDAWWDFYNQGSEGACLKAGTLIRMADGSHKPIEDIRLLDRVLTAEGRDGAVLATFVRFNSDGMVNLSLAGHRHLALTGNHPVLTRNGYVRSDELRLGDEVALLRYLPETNTTLETAPFLAELDRRIRRDKRLVKTGGVATEVAAIPRTIALTPRLGRLVGLFLAEGGTTPNKVVWTFGGHERDTLVAETVDLLRSELGAEGRVQIRPSGATNVVLYGRHWRTLFERLFRHGPYDKRLPGELSAGPADFLRGVWDGWVAGDGYEQEDRHRMIAVTVSRGLAMDMYAIGQALGLRPTIERRRGKPNGAAATRRDAWRVTVSTGGRSTRSSQDDVYVWRKVVGLEHEEWAGFVFNFEVEGDHSYVAEGVGVHNCVGFGISRLTSQLNRKLYDGFWLYHEAQRIDEWPGEDYDGTSVRAGLDILRKRGHCEIDNGNTKPEAIGEGIKANRWARSVDDVLTTLGYDGLDYVDVLNSWGRSYPHLTRMPAKVLERLWKEDGEVGLVTDR